MEHLEINKAAAQKKKKKELELLRLQHTSKKKYERIKPFADFLNYIAHFCQLNSFSLAAAGSCAAVWFSMGSKGLPFMFLCVFAFALVEIAVMLSMKTHSSMMYDDKVVSPVIYIGLVVSLGISTPTTYYTTPYALQLLTSAPTLRDTSSIRVHADVKIKTDTSYWHDQKRIAKIEADTFKKMHQKRDCKTCRWRFSSKGDAGVIHAGLTKKVSNMQDSINAYLARGEKEKTLALKEANSENKVTKAKYFAWCESFGWILALISVAAMLILIPCRYYYEYWKREYENELETDIEFHERKESETDSHIPTESETDTDGETDNRSKVKNVTKTEEKTPRTVITAFATNKSSTTRNCIVCNTDISEKRSDAKFCGDKCRVNNHKSKKK